MIVTKKISSYRKHKTWFFICVLLLFAITVILCLRPSPASANLVINGDFESGVVGWSGGEQDQTDPHWGNVALFVEDLSNTQSAAGMTIDPISVLPESRYLFQVWVHGSVPSQIVEVGIYQYDASDQWISGANKVFDVESTTGWTLFKEIIDSLHPQAAGIRIVLRPVDWTADGSLMGEAWFDDVSFDLYDGNLVENGGFENGLTGWTGTGASSLIYAHTGTRSLEINDASQNGVIEMGSASPIPILKDRNYLFQFWVRGTREGQQIQGSIDPLGADQKHIGGNMNFTFVVGTEWTLISRLIQGFQAETEYISIHFRPAVYDRSGYFTGKAYYDDVYFGLHDGDLLSNGGFESGDANWMGSDFQIVENVAHSGSGAMLMEDGTASIMSVPPPTDPEPWAQSQEFIPIKRDSIYLLQAWVRGTMEGQRGSIIIKQFDGKKQPLQYADIQDSMPVGPDWSQYQKIIRSFHQDAVYVQIHLSPAVWASGNEGVRRIWFDDVTFIPYQDNLVENGSFERGSLGWLEGTLVTDAHEGSHAIHVEDDSTTTNVNVYMSDLIPVARDGTYTFSAWMQTATSDPIQMTINQYDGNRQWIPNANKNYTAPGSADWSCVQFTVSDFHSEAAWVRPYLRADRWTSAGELVGAATFDQVLFRYEERPDEGYWLPEMEGFRLWWSPPDQKIQRGLILQDNAPQASGVKISAARGESESMQLVLLPSHDETILSSTVSAFSGPGSIPSSNVTLREVAYVPLDRPTDYWDFTGCEMPDPLPTLGRLDLKAGKQQPIWITVDVPLGIPAGVYTGRITLEIGKERELSIPVEIEVWDFDMPQEHHLRTAFGLSLGEIDQYHHLGGDPDLRRNVLRLYLQDFADHRISPYDSIGDDWYGIEFYNLNWVGGNFVADSDPSYGTVLQVVDDNSGDGTVSYLRSTIPIPIDITKNYDFSWNVKAGGLRNHAGTDYAIVVEQYDANNQWISGKNIGIVENAGALDTWDTGGRRILRSDWDSNVSYVQIFLFARSYRIGDATGTTWYDNLSFAIEGSTVNMVQNPGFDPIAPRDLEVHLTETTRFDDAAQFAFNLGLDSLRITLPDFSTITASSGISRPTLLEYPWGTTAYQEAYPNVVQAIADHLRSKGWLDESYAYWVDEPEPGWLGEIDYGTNILKSGASDLTKLIVANTLYDESGLVDNVDVWTIETNFFDPTWGKDLLAKGKDLWWYVCSAPRDPYANYFIDYPGIDIRSYFWSAWKYEVQGVLYWEVNYWRPMDVSGGDDPWGGAGSYDTSSVSWWGNGDGRLLYPPRNWTAASSPLIEGPVPSIRWELIRESIEDYNYFWMLREAKDRLKALNPSDPLVAVAEDLLSIPENIIVSLTEYESDSDVYSEYRRELADTLVKVLAKAPAPLPTPTHTPSATATPMTTTTPSVTYSPTPTSTATPTVVTITPSVTPSKTPTSTVTPTVVTITPSVSPSSTPRSTATPWLVTITPTFTPAWTATPRLVTITPTFTPARTATPRIATITPTTVLFFEDVLPDHWAYAYIKALYDHGYVKGCSSDPLAYCPEEGMQRDEASVFVGRGVHGTEYFPAEPTQQVFVDVITGVWHTKWINDLELGGYTDGCGLNGMGERIFCPYDQHTRAEATVFFLRMLYGPGFQPPLPNVYRTFIYDDVPVISSLWYPKWIYAAYDAGLVEGCEDDANRGDLLYRPEEVITRAEAACMMAHAVGLD